jgi:hypothetical protein
VSQNSVFVWKGKSLEAKYGIDGDMETSAHTNCGWNTDLWYKMKFGAVYCFSHVVITQGDRNLHAARMQDTNVFVVNTATNTRNFCGVLKISDNTTIEAQTYKIPCKLKCGDEVKLTLRHDSGEYTHEGCIHIIEIKAYTGLLLLADC